MTQQQQQQLSDGEQALVEAVQLRIAGQRLKLRDVRKPAGQPKA